MWGERIATGMVLAMFVVPVPSLAQQLVWKDQNVVRKLSIPTDSGHTFVRLRISQQVEYALTFSSALFINWNHDLNANQLMLLQDMIYQCRVETERRFRITQKIVHHLGIQYFFDSISRFHVDDNQFETRLECRLKNNHGCFLSSILSTRLFNAYNFSVNKDGYLIRTLRSSFLTPLTGLFSGGFQLKWPLFGSINFGITSAKLTWIRDKGIFDALGTAIYYGVPENKKCLFEYGISLQLLIDHEVVKWLHWNCDLLIFKHTNLSPDISFKNNLGFRLAKFLKVRIQTRIFYEERVSRKVQLENMVSVGLVVTL
ncbi:MAG: hypothetical protein ABIJ04_08040 [Bacteroidota bacterium]